MMASSREHRPGCPALLAWDIPDACRCDYPVVTRCNRCGTIAKRGATNCRYCDTPSCASTGKPLLDGAGVTDLSGDGALGER